MATDRDGNYKPSPALDRYTVEGERLRLQNPALTEVQRRQTRIHLRALQRADKERGERLKAQREEEARRLQQRRAEARDNRAATYAPTWDSPTHPHPTEQAIEPPAAEPWEQDTAYLDPITDDQNEGR